MKKTIFMIFAIIMMSSLSVFAKEEIKVTVDKKVISFESSPFVENNRVLTPLRETFEALGVEVEWNDETKTVTCKKDGGIIELVLGESIASINGKNISLDVKPQIINERNFVPLRFISETLGADVKWNAPKQTVVINKGSNTIKYRSNRSVNDLDLKSKKYVAHAGGKIDGKVLTNSKEALEQSYRNGYNLVELDMQWSTDGNLVLVHDWGNFAEFIGSNDNKAYSAKEFTSLKMFESLTPMSIGDLANWLENNYGVYIVTDIKESNVQALKFIKDKYPHLIDRFVPQVYSFEEYKPVREMGYDNIIFTMYASNYGDKEILDFSRSHKLFAVTMPIYNAKTNLAWFLKNQGIYTYAHTVNGDNKNELKNSSVIGYYTDDILP